MTRKFRCSAFPVILAACLAGFTLPSTARGLGGNLAISAVPEEEKAEGKGAGRELLFKVINFGILAGALGYLLRKPMAAFFSSRSQEIEKSLEEGRKALEASQAKLEAVEEKLRHLEEEIAALKGSAAREMETERQRLRQAAAEEAEKILEAARAQIETSIRAAKLELKSFTAEQAVQLAQQLIQQRLDDAGRKRLVSQFVANLESRETRN